MSVARITTVLAAAAATATLLTAATPADGAAPGAPGEKATWTAADKHGFGTSRTPESEVWFTLRPGQLSEVFYPDLGTPARATWSSSSPMARAWPSAASKRTPGAGPGRPRPGLRADRHLPDRPLADGPPLRHRSRAGRRAPRRLVHLSRRPPVRRARRGGPRAVQLHYYLRLTKDGAPDAGTVYNVGDGGADLDQRTVVDPSFLELVRLGIVPADDPVVRNTLAVVDRELGVDTPSGEFWHRFTDDGYGEDAAGGPWEPTDAGSQRTAGRAWPIFAGERGEFELLAGTGDPAARLRAMAEPANDGLMIAEQVWDQYAPSGQPGHPAGEGTFSATPLTWSHAQLMRLAWSIDAGAPVERPSVVTCEFLGADC